MKKVKINKTVILTLKSVSLFVIFTIMLTTLTSCKSNKKINNDDMSSSITTSSDDELTYSSETSEEITSSELEENNSLIESTTSNTSHQNSKPSSNITSSIPSNPSSINNNQSSSNGNQNSSNNLTDSIKTAEDLTNFIPLTTQNISDMHGFNSAVYKMTCDITGRTHLGTTFGYYYKDKKIQSSMDGFDECSIILAMANQKYLTSEDFSNVFQNKSLTELQKNIYLLQMFNVRSIENRKVSWNSYMLDKSLANYIEDMQNETYNQLLSGSSNFIEKFNKFFYEKTGQYVYGQNSILDILITNYAISIYRDDPSSDIFFDVYYANQESLEKLENDVSNIYNEVLSKSKILEDR